MSRYKEYRWVRANTEPEWPMWIGLLLIAAAVLWCVISR